MASLAPPGPRRSAGPGLVLAAALVAIAAPSSTDAQVVERFEVLSVATVGCNSGQFSMNVLRSNLDGNAYFVRTRVQVGTLLYMNEQASISINGPSGWAVFDNFTYGIVPNRGAYPINPNATMTLDFTLERPKGIVLSSWRLVVDGCDTGTILSNAGPIFLSGFEVDGTSRWSTTVT